MRWQRWQATAHVWRLRGTVGLLLVGTLTLTGSQPIEGVGSHAERRRIENLPGAVDIDPSPRTLETFLVAVDATVDIGNGVLANAQTFNGAIPGPEFRLRVGDRVIVHFTNLLAEPSSIHWHGIELDNESDGTGVTQNPVLTGGTFTYRFIVPRPGVYFYHSHIMPTNPSFKGFYGSIIVEEPAEQTLIGLGVLPDERQTMTLIMGDTTVCKAAGSNDTATFPADPSLPWIGTEELPGHPPFPGLTAAPTPKDLCETPRDADGFLITPAVPHAAGDIPNIQPRGTGCTNPPFCPPPRINEGQLVLANGRVPAARGGSPSTPGLLAPAAEVIEVKAGDGVRLRLLSGSTTRYFRLRMTDQNGQHVTLYRVGGQGGLLDRVRVEGGVQGRLDTLYDAGEILLSVAERQDVVFVVPDGQLGDIVTLWTEDYRRVGMGPGAPPGGFSGLPTVPIAHFRIMGLANRPFWIFEGEPLLLNPAVNAPVENLKELSTNPIPLFNPPPSTGSGNPTLALTTTTMLPAIDTVNGSIFDEGLPGGDFTTIPHIPSSRYAAVGDLLELTISNTTNAHHPWHPHGFSIQPVRFVENASGTSVREFTYNEFVDVVDIPPGLSLVYRVKLTDRARQDFVTPGGAIGRWVMHCHIFFHAALGMITELVVLTP